MPAADRAVVWRVGDALLAAPLEAVLEVAGLDGQGRARAREGALPLRTPPGLPPPADPDRAVVVRTPDGPAALAADDVEGVREWNAADRAALPAWLQEVPAAHVTALVRLDDRRIAALLDLDGLAGG